MSDPGSGSPVGREAVSVVLTDGRCVSGTVEDFSPHDLELAIDGPDHSSELVPLASVAYVAFHASPGKAASPVSNATAFKIHLRKGEVVPVFASPAQRPRGGDFRALPRADQRYRELYFFGHAVRFRERDEPIGTMLVSSGAVHAEVLEHAISAQQAHQNTPIGKLLVEAFSVSESELARAVSLQKQTNHRIGDLLIEEGLATAEQVDRALAEQRRRKTKRIGEVLLDLDIVSEETLARTLAHKFDLGYVDLDKNPPDPRAFHELSREDVVRHNILPIQSSPEKLVLAIGDPLSLESTESLGLAPGREIEEVVVAKSALRRWIDELLVVGPKPVEVSEFDFVLASLGDARPSPLRPPAHQRTPLPSVILDSGPPDTLSTIVLEAIRRGATDIHIEPDGPGVEARVRFRIGGELADGPRVPAHERERLSEQLKSMARLDVAERQRPQHGRVRFEFSRREREFRVATLPTQSGVEDVVLRALPARKSIASRELDLSEQNHAELERWLLERAGLVLAVGPPRAGKATVIRALLALLAGPERAIGTLEESIEVIQPGLRQVAVTPASGLTFASGLEALLLQDMDAIFVAALADSAAATAAVDAALGNQLLFSKVRAKSAATALGRLVASGVDRGVLADALLGVVNLRLVRRVCGACRQRIAATPDQEKAVATAYGADDFARDFAGQKPRGLWLQRGRGCSTCNDSGFCGQIGVHELLGADEAVRGAIARGAPADELTAAVRGRGFRTLIQDGVQKALRGDADLDEVLRACRL